MIRKVLITLFSAAFLAACTNPVSNSAETNQSFYLGNHQIQLFLPASWTTINPKNLRGKFFLANKLESNLSLTLGTEWSENAGDQLVRNLRSSFGKFALLTQSKKRWEFTAQQNSADPAQQFIQTVTLVPDSTDFVLTSCSFRADQAEPDCETILDSVQIQVDKGSKGS